ncbi:SRPBCC family protein [Sphaerisporangium aureirubrum]|uniref:SRPBCC family protein n=1 Tax=Sphaerisporangium aureirubrum TaxID=1544736 RepID=A0ABW1NU09_9ACTN
MRLLPRRRVTHELSFEVGAPLSRVFAAYSDVGNHLGKHSFLRRIITHRDWYEDDTRHVDFTAVERIPVAGVPVTSRTHARQRIHPAEFFYETDTRSAPGVVTHQKVVFLDLGDGRTGVTEHLTFEANSLLIGFAVTMGVAAHKETQAALKKALENGEL